jgi:alkyl sulfatase BDS1-like metallo-beta-lactamase superfamily hydrolase
MASMPHESTSAFPFEDRTDFDDADRGFVGALVPAQVTAADGRVVWDNDAYDFLAGECPDTAHPSLWRQGQLCARQGLYEVTPGIYQVRGLDISNMTIVEGDTGVIVIDPLTCKETAAAAVALYRHHRGDRPMRGLIYTHAHADHYGGAKGVLVDDVPILAPHGFVEAAVSENVYAGPAMTRRSMYMYGALLPKGPAGQIGSGLGQTVPIGTVGLVPPTVEITRTGQEEVIDGVVFRFQITPGTECPAEMNFLLPQRRALCMAENATHNLHNLLTLRGALVRDPRVWARYLNEAIALFCDDIDVSFASHHWPTWGRDRVVTYLSQQRDLYAYLHDQTLRLMNQGHTGIEIAEMLDLPPALEAAWHTHGYYGSVSHNVKAIYQRYMGWFDGNPASLWQHPPVERATRYLECMGGADAVIEHATRYVARGDLRFAVQLLNDVVFAEPDNDAARQALAGVYEQLGHGAENGTWRNFYLMGALELRQGISQRPPGSSNLDMVAALSIEQLFDAVAIRVDGPRAWDEQLTIDWNFSDLGETYRTSLSNGVLVQQPDPPAADVDLTLTLTKAQLLRVVFGRQLDGVAHEGDLDAVERLLGLLDRAATNFPIVTP